MQKDFHYYCVAVLAQGAGFNTHDALDIAYASQYVDDATESDLIRLDIGKEDLKFDPVRTSYMGLQSLHSITWSAQKRVWMPFHFVPPRPFDPAQAATFSYITKPHTPFAQLLLEEAGREPMDNHKRRLCRIGVALHTFADTWTHQDFSGRQNREENDVESIEVYDESRKRWDKLGIENLLFDTLPMVGHAQAGYFPDLAFVQWKCVIGSERKRPVERTNPDLLLDAARTIYERLLPMDKQDPATPIPWANLEPRIIRLLARKGAKPGYVDRFSMAAYRAFQALDVDDRCEAWQNEFRDLFQPDPDAYAYDRKAWRSEAIKGDTDWDDYSQAEWAQMLPREVRGGFWDSMWVHFHRAALRQRHSVLERMP